MPPVNTPETTVEDEFAAAFAAEVAPPADTADADKNAADDAAIAAAKAEDDAEMAAADAASATDEGAGEGEGTETPPAAKESAPPAAEVTPPADTTDYKAEAVRLQAELDVAKKAPPAAVEDTAVEEFAMPEAPTAKTVLSDEEYGVVTAYEEEWPDVARAEALKRKVDIAVMTDQIYREVATALKGILGTVAPIVESAQLSADEKHYAAIEAAHPDYLEVVKNIDGWVEKQPAYLKTAMNAVLDNGSAAEVNDLFTRFKQETGRVTPQVKSDQPLLQNTVDDAAVQALTPVTGGRRQAVSSAVDPNDFGGAWANAAQQ